jgi:chorismate mutase
MTGESRPTVRAINAALYAGVALYVMSGTGDAVAKADGAAPLTKLVDDAAQRLLTADPVAAFKYVTGGAVDDPAREQQVLDSVTKAAVDKGVDPGFVRDVFRDQIDATASVEHSRFAEWKINPGSVPGSAPDLSSSRDTINALNEAMVDDIAQHWDALQVKTCRADLDRAKAAVVSTTPCTGIAADDVHRAVETQSVRRCPG